MSSSAISPALRSRLEFGAKAFLVVSFLGTLTAGVMRLQQKALADESHLVDLGAWTIVEKPSWATSDDVRAIRNATRLRGWKTSLLDPGAGPVVWRAIDLAPTVVRVAGMRKCDPNQFEAVIEMRRPVAAVQIGGSGANAPGKTGSKTPAHRSPAGAPAWVEVDECGIALSPPLPTRPVREGRPLRAVTGVSGPAPAVGSPFGPDVIEASDLLTELDVFGTDAEHALLAAIDEVDVSNFGGRKKPDTSEIVLRASAPVPPAVPGTASVARAPSKPGRRCEIEWGRARPADAYDPEPLFGAKATRLVQVLRMFPGLDGLATVKVAFDDLVVVPTQGSPLTQSK